MSLQSSENDALTAVSLEDEIAAQLAPLKRRLQKISLAGWIVLVGGTVVQYVLPWIVDLGIVANLLLTPVYWGIEILGIAMIAWGTFSPAYNRLLTRLLEDQSVPATGRLLDVLVQVGGGKTRRQFSDAVARLLPQVDNLAAAGLTEDRLNKLLYIVRNPRRFPTDLELALLVWIERMGDERFIKDVRRLTKSKEYLLVPSASMTLAALEERQRASQKLAMLLRPAGAVEEEALLHPVHTTGDPSTLLKPSDAIDPRGLLDDE